MTKKYVNVPVSLVELSSDSEDDAPVHPPVPQSPAPPVVPSDHSSTRTPRRHPAVSDDTSYVPRGPSAQPPRATIPAPRSPTPRLQPMHVVVPPSVPRPHYQARTAAGPVPPHLFAPRDYHPAPHPYSVYEHGESSRHANQYHRMDALASQVREIRSTLFELLGNQGRLVGRMGEMEEEVLLWHQTAEHRAQVNTEKHQRGHESLARRTTLLEWWVLAVSVAALVAVLVELVPRFLRK